MENDTYLRGGTQKEHYTQEEVESVACPLCASSRYSHIATERGALSIVRCSECSLIYVNPRLKQPEKIYWGDKDRYFEEARLIFLGKASHHRDKNYVADLKLIASHKPSGRFLDVGTNMGFFLRNASNMGWDLYGVEPSPPLSELAREHFGLNVKTAFLETAGFDQNFFNIVCMSDVFEHIPNPSTFLDEVRRILKPDGILFTKVPNGLFNILKFKLTTFIGKGNANKYDIFDSYEHVVHYTHDTLRMMLQKNGFDVTTITFGRPIQLPVWHKYVGHYYQYPSPKRLDFKHFFMREFFYWLGYVEFFLRSRKIGYFLPNIIAISRKIQNF